jgi:hypothetical protein
MAVIQIFLVDDIDLLLRYGALLRPCAGFLPTESFLATPRNVTCGALRQFYAMA